MRRTAHFNHHVTPGDATSARIGWGLSWCARGRAVRAIVCGVVLAVFVAGCSAAPPAAEIREKDDPFSPAKTMATGFVRVPSPVAVVGLQLVAEVDKKTGDAKAIARVQLLYNDAHGRKYETARNDRAEALPLVTQAAKGRCALGNQCPHEEIVAVTLPLADLRRVSGDGYRFKLFARIGPDVLVTVPRDLAANIVASVDGVGKKKG